MDEVFAVLFVKEGHDVSGVNWFRDTQFRQVFSSLEKARTYCENQNSYCNEFSEWFVDKFDPSWDDSGLVYTLLCDDDFDIHFVIKPRNYWLPLPLL